MILGLCLIQIIIHCLDHGRSEFLAAEAISAADHFDIFACFSQRGHDIFIQRLAERTGFFGTVQNGNALAGCGECFDKFLGSERAIQTNFNESEFITFSIQIVDGFLNYICAAAHADDYVLSIFCSDIVKQMIAAAGDLADFVHIVLDGLRNRIVVRIRSFTCLEINIRVLSGTAEMGMIRVHSACTETCHCITVKQFVHICIVDHFDLLYFMRSTEAIEEVAERNAGLDRGKMCYQCQVHNFLHGSRCQESKSGLTAGHYVTVISED